jgi:hypothetical protein
MQRILITFVAKSAPYIAHNIVFTVSFIPFSQEPSVFSSDVDGRKN